MKWTKIRTMLALVLLVAAGAAAKTEVRRTEIVKSLLADIHGARNVDPTAVLAATRMSNELVSQECREAAMDHTLEVHTRIKNVGLDKAEENIRKHVAKRRKALESGKFTWSQWFEHVYECKGFCGPYVTGILDCHVQAVSRAEHEIVLFPLNQFEVPESYAAVVRSYARKLADDPERKVLLFGRASKVGQQRDGSIDHNIRLSKKRALAVRRELVAHGVDDDRIEQLWAGFQPPQLNATIAVAYGLERQFEQLGQERLNQSVMMVLYP